MPPHPSFANEKSPVEKWEYEGLQLDTRARENQDKHLDGSKPQGFLDDDFDNSGNYLNEKQSHGRIEYEGSPTSPHSGQGVGFSPITPIEKPMGSAQNNSSSKGVAGEVDSPPSIPPEPKICGLRRKRFWELFGLILALLVAVAVIGGVVGGLQARNRSPHPPPSGSTPASSSGSTNTTSLNPVQPGDVIAGSPLTMVTYDQGPGQSPTARQAFRMYFQTANGNVKEAISLNQNSWTSADPIFTDALNNSGLAAVTYLNGTSQQGSIFYVGANGLLQEKRKIFNNTDYWEPGTLNNLNIPATGNTSIPSQGSNPENDWEGYRMAAVYSVNFDDGPGIRLFYHAVQLNGTSLVQELVWNQKNDSWSRGAQLSRPYPNSHLAAAVDENSKILRVFFSSGSNTLAEEWLNITNIQDGYNPGIDFENLLLDDAADLAAVALFGTTYVYHYSAAEQKTAAGIRELTITGIPNSINNQETFNISSSLVAAPMLTSNGKSSLYQPLAASYSAVLDEMQSLYVVWADKITGDPTTPTTGFGELSQISRPLANTTWPSTGQQPIPLGSKNAEPS